VNIEDLEKLGVSGIVILGATTAIRWVVKKLESTERKVDESEKYNRDRDKQDSDLIKGLSGVIIDHNNKNDRIIEKLNEILVKLNNLSK
tara:strand:+ start:224 stop:490 length:267 start_codon:yes stop_codon:yes gene_type:complete